MSERYKSRAFARFALAVTAIASMGVLATTAPSAVAASKHVKPLRITRIKDAGGFKRHTVLSVRAPKGWTIGNARECTGLGYDVDGQKHAASGTSGYGRYAKIEFDRGVLVQHSNLKVRCPRLEHTYYTTSYETHWTRRYTSRHGTNTSSREATRSCHLNPDLGWLIVDCWGGDHASVSYRFHMPSDARGISHWSNGSRGCCSNGHVYKSWSHSGNADVYRVTVTNWAGYTVKKVGLSYLTQVRHKVRHRHVIHALGKGRRA